MHIQNTVLTLHTLYDTIIYKKNERKIPMSENPLKIPCIVLTAVSVVSMTSAGIMAVNIDKLKNTAVPQKLW